MAACAAFAVLASPFVSRATPPETGDSQATGELWLSVRAPGARVSLDGVALGVGPLERLLSLDAGVHEIDIELPGGERLSRTVDVIPNHRLGLSPDLRATAGMDDLGALETWGWLLVGAGAVTAGVGVYYLADPPVDTTRGERVTIARENLTPGTVLATIGGVVASAGALMLLAALLDEEPDAALSTAPSGRPVGAIAITF